MLSTHMHAFIASCSSQRALDSLLPPAAALLSAIGLWVASRARSTSEAAQSTSQDLEQLVSGRLDMPVRSASRRGAPDRKK